MSGNTVHGDRNTICSADCTGDLRSTLAVECTASTKDRFVSGIWGEKIIGSGQTFEDAPAFRLALYQYSVAKGFAYKFRKNSKSYISVDCRADGCPWHLTAYKMRETEFMVVGTFVDEHDHNAQDSIDGRPQPKSKFAAAIIAEKLHLQPETTPNQIRTAFEADCGVRMTYKQAWLCKEQSLKKLHGNAEDSYRLVPWMCDQIKDADPQSVAMLTYDVDWHFKQLFIAYGCSIVGFLNGCRGLVFIDGCHLSGPYKGTLLSASSIDANNQLFPLAFAVVRSESLEDWTWFLGNLKSNVTRDVSVTIMSDRHQNIITAVGETYGRDCHAYCYRHIKENFSSEVNKVMPGGKKVKEQALMLLDAVVYARVEPDYEVAMNNLARYKKELAEWVVNNEPEHWLLSKFGHRRWDHITSNVAESFNAWVVKERRQSIIPLINQHRDKLAQKIYKSKTEVKNWKNGVGQNVDLKLQENIARGKYFTVFTYSDFRAKVTQGGKDVAVDLANRECTCLAWQMSGLPCAHACAVVDAKRGDIYGFVEECYKSVTQELIYAVTMAPVETHNPPAMPQSEVNGAEPPLKPPLTKRPPGRPKVKRIESQFIKKRPIQCSKCKQVGHNRASCRSPNPCNI